MCPELKWAWDGRWRDLRCKWSHCGSRELELVGIDLEWMLLGLERLEALLIGEEGLDYSCYWTLIVVHVISLASCR